MDRSMRILICAMRNGLQYRTSCRGVSFSLPVCTVAGKGKRWGKQFRNQFEKDRRTELSRF
jgi:hypothetical protein